MDASPSSAMVGEYAVRTPESNHNSTRINSSKAQRASNLDKITARIRLVNNPSPSSSSMTNGTADRISNTGGSISSMSARCYHCGSSIGSTDSETCESCKEKHSQLPSTSVQIVRSPEIDIGIQDEEIAQDCSLSQRLTMSNSFSMFTSVSLSSPTTATTSSSSANTSSTSTPMTPSQAQIGVRKSSAPLLPKLSALPSINTDFDDDFLPAQVPTNASFTSSVDEEMSLISNSEVQSAASSPTPTGSSVSPDLDGNENSSGHEFGDSRIKNGSTSANKSKKASSRQTSMKTRSGGKPPSTSYANLGKDTTTERRKPGAKGKGKGKSATNPKPRRARNSNKMHYIQSLSNSIRQDSEDTNESDKPKTRQTDENDYIRTAIVSSSENLYVRNAPMCLICGSIGRDAEASMMCCMSCSQTYHTYCVDMHQKLNKTIVKRGWRCLQCTVCEACGDGADESNLLLCDECDVAFHTYCLEPKLEQIPTGSWRCHWCATCRRCNKQVQSGLDLPRQEGLCEQCYSQRKCSKCSNFYELGDLLIKCQHCLRWVHGKCEELHTEEQLENAYENAFRCSLCKPKGNSDFASTLHNSVIVDNVMVNKSTLEMWKFGKAGTSLGDISVSYRSQSTDQGEQDDGCDEYDANGRPRANRTAGPGRKGPKLGVGGFIVKNRNRLAQSVDDEPQEESDEKSIVGKTNKRKPRKPRRHELEDAYPVNIQIAFWGGTGYDGKTLVEMTLDEPNLLDAPHCSLSERKHQNVYELSEQAAEVLQRQQDDDMLGDIISANLDMDMDMDSIDFSDLLADDDEEFDDFDNHEEHAGSAQAYPSEAGDSNALSNMLESKPDTSNLLPRTGRQEKEDKNAAAWRLFEDEKLGDKATKAAVLYVNLVHPELKKKYPNWVERVKQFHRMWRALDSKERSKYVALARENRAHRKPTSRKRISTNQDSSGSGPGGLMDETSQGATDTEASQDTTSLAMNGVETKNGSLQSQSQERQPIPQLQHMMRPLDATQISPVSQNNGPTNVDHASFASVNQPSVSGSVLHYHDSQPSTASESRNGSMSCEAQQQYDSLVIELKALHDQQKGMEEELVTQRRAKKALTAKKRTLTKKLDQNGQPMLQDLAPQDQERLDEVMRKIPESAKEVDRIKRACRELQSKKEEIEAQYGLDSSADSNSGASPLHDGQDPLAVNIGIAQGAFPSDSTSPSHKLFSSISPDLMSPNLNGTTVKEEIKCEGGEMHGSSGGFPPAKARGRKRKKPVLDSILLTSRSSTLGGIPYSSLKSDEERQVYDLVDYLLQNVERDNEGPNVQRILNIHAPHHVSNQMNATDLDAPRKKKRTVNKKVPPVDETNEYQTVVENLIKKLTELPHLHKNTLNPVPAFDPMFTTSSETSKLPENNECAQVQGDQFGNINLAFMPDFYDEFENHCDIPEHKPMLPVRCSEIYAGIQLEPTEELAKLVDQDDEVVYSESGGAACTRLRVANELPRDELEQLSLDRIAERAGCDVIIPHSGRWPDTGVPPMDPPRSAYYWEEYSNDIELDLVMDQEEDAKMNDVIAQIAAILELNECPQTKNFDFEIGPTPALSPDSEACSDVGDLAELTDISLDYFQDEYGEYEGDYVTTNDLPFIPKCKQEEPEQPTFDLADALEESVPVASGTEDRVLCNGLVHPMEDVMECDDDGSNPSLPISAAASNRVTTESTLSEPLSIEIAEEGSDTELPSPTDGEDSDEDADIGEFDTNAILDILRHPREQEFTVAELPVPPKPVVEVTPGGSRAFKFRGQGWMVCDERLLGSFNATQDETKDVLRRNANALKHLMLKDDRKCVLCGEIGDGNSNGTGRLLNVDANEWVHVNCAIFSAGVHESDCGGLNNVQDAIRQSRVCKCHACNRNGASIQCIRLECALWYHLPCALKSGCKFQKDTLMVCSVHSTNLHQDAIVEELSALRRIYIEREENALLAKIYNHSFSADMMMRVGNLTFFQIGQLVPSQRSFHTSEFIYPIGYRVTRCFWHPTQLNERVHYECLVDDEKPSTPFHVWLKKGDDGVDPKWNFKESSPSAAWHHILASLQQTRERNNNVLRFFPSQVSGEGLFGFTEVAISKMIESLPGISLFPFYMFKHGGSPLMDVPLGVNATGCARTEPFAAIRSKRMKAFLVSPQKMEDRPCSSQGIAADRRIRRKRANDFNGIYDEETLKQLKASGFSEEMLASGSSRGDMSQSQIFSRYKKMKEEWKNFVFLGRSAIAGFGLYAKKDIDMCQLVCEYVGEVIRNEVCEVREKRYAKRNKGIYMFRLDAEYVVDATMCGNMARYINHSCDPNCVTDVVIINNTKKIVIRAGRPIRAGEELTYDYQFELEDTKDKIPCLCGAPNCVKWMN